MTPLINHDTLLLMKVTSQTIKPLTKADQLLDRLLKAEPIKVKFRNSQDRRKKDTYIVNPGDPMYWAIRHYGKYE